mmetsp:Transcript_11333/g.43759  ORF Transcript_11333/g.43759 Transcript_11333/m.43759 type:complete len:286 (-) Transcript_11333:30-887(-)
MRAVLHAARRHVGRHLHDVLEVGPRSAVGPLPRQELVQRDPEAVIVRRDAVLVAAHEHLGCHVWPRSRGRKAPPILVQLARHSQVSDPQLPGVIQQQVLGLDVTMQHALAMHVVEGEHDANGVKLGLLLCEPPRRRLHDLVVEVPAQAGVHDNVQMAVVLEGVVHVHEPRVPEAGQQVSLPEDHLRVIPVQNHMLPERFHRKHLSHVRLHDLDNGVHDSESTLPDHPLSAKVGLVDTSVLGRGTRRAESHPEPPRSKPSARPQGQAPSRARRPRACQCSRKGGTG